MIVNLNVPRPSVGLAALLAALAVVELVAVLQTGGTRPSSYRYPGQLPSQILRARGYLAKDFNLKSKDGYSFRVTRGRNPLINNGTGPVPGRRPILFVPSVFQSNSIFVTNSKGVRPTDFSDFELADLSLEDANGLFGGVPSAKALPFLAMDFGHEIWILNRRGFIGHRERTGSSFPGNGTESGGRGKKGNQIGQKKDEGPIGAIVDGIEGAKKLAKEIPLSFDGDYWNYSLDEQAEYDLPQAVKLIRKETGLDRIAVVGHGAGGALILMSMILHPELNNQFGAVILWSESFSLGKNDLFSKLVPALPVLQLYVGSVPPAFAADQLRALIDLICSTPLVQSTLCEGIADLIFGFSAGRQPINPEFANSAVYVGSSHELAQLVQSAANGGRMHSYANLFESTPEYDLSKITNDRLSFYVGATDSVVTPADVELTVSQLRVPHQFHLIDSSFNHDGYFYQRNNRRLAIIPSLKEIQMLCSLDN